jgi:hypothetical protein
MGDRGQFVAHTKYEVSAEELAAAFLVTIPKDSRGLDHFELVIDAIDPALEPPTAVPTQPKRAFGTPFDSPSDHFFEEPCGSAEGTDHCWYCGSPKVEHLDDPTEQPR